MKILVTGAAGFIGMHLTERLIAGGHDVVGLDNFNDYYQVSLKEARHARLTALKGYMGHRIDLCDADALNRLFADEKFDVVCNLAAQAGVRYSLENPDVYVKSNLGGFVNILECCRHHDVPRLVYASSSSVYGGNVKIPFSEDDRVDNPVSLYAATKKSNELMAHTYSHLFGLQTIGLRFFTVYGPWGRPDMALWLFTEAMLAGRSIKVFNHGRMRRDFTYIDDIVTGVVSSLFAENLDRCEVLNIGNCRSEELMHLIEAIAKALGVEPKMTMLPMQPGDVPATYADITRIREKLGFEPTTTIETGVPRFVEWYRAYHGI
ncbi:MAG: NAD-dependent epimerase [Kiritimatiellia bacterium]|jgi:UDP-glucuronate 4-epimerase